MARQNSDSAFDTLFRIGFIQRYNAASVYASGLKFASSTQYGALRDFRLGNATTLHYV